LPALYGLESRSDDPATAGFEDSTRLAVNRFDEGSLFYHWFLCHGETLLLDASQFGANLQWSTGATTPALPVTQGGGYNLQAGTACESVVVSHDVTSASCPFTVEVWHEFLPDTLFPCSELIFRFVIDNDSGEPRVGVALSDTLPAGFTALEMVRNPFGGQLSAALPTDRFVLENMTLPAGRDTLDLRVEVGDLPPGAYRSRARLYNLPVVMGPLRWSDDPATAATDSSAVVLRGSQVDSTFFQRAVCPGGEIVLDARALGENLRWDDGSTDPVRRVSQPGDYRLTVLDGCHPTDVWWEVAPGPAIAVSPSGPYFIHQGETVRLEPALLNAGDLLNLVWTDPEGQSLSCADCPDPLAGPLYDARYELRASNEVCSDSAAIEVFVDRSRRIYAPNAFSPNGDGLHEWFYLQSPDFGVIRSLAVAGRWGEVIFHSRSSQLNVESTGWDGRRQGRELPSGVYVWWAEVEFIDGEREVFKGDVTVVR
jgi:gliding motility-associated-like protein